MPVLGLAGSPAGAQAPAITTHKIRVEPDLSKAVHAANGATLGCQTRPTDGSAGPRCYSPAQIERAYGFTRC